ncbi:MAG: redoxin domain-containing protein [Solirubrobacteraceae bacterium]|nr:redoxin domain-containing protein [Solirubrobacteraceae bacterium]
MAVLALFAFLAGAATALSPCILPVLPIALSAGATGGRRRPLGIVLGLTASFTAATVLLVYAIDALGLPDALVRQLAVATLVGFGVVLVVPSVAARVEGLISRLTARMPVPAVGGTPSAAGTGGTGLGSGIVVGLALGVVYAPCAGPILAGVVTTSAAQTLTVERVAIALAYAAGTGLVLYAIMRGGRRLTRPLARRTGRFQQATGAVMVVLGLAMAAQLDIRFQQEIATALPAVVVNPTGALEERATDGKLTALRGTAVQDVPTTGALAGPVDRADQLPDLGPAKGFVGTQVWWNTPGGKPLSLSQLRGKVVLVDFWTYSCINCIRTFPQLRALDSAYRRHGLVIVGVHAPEFAFERSARNVERAIRAQGLTYPITQDNAFKTWDAYGNLYWPASYLIDARGQLRYRRAGEGGVAAKEAAIRALLRDAGAEGLDDPIEPDVPSASSGVLTAETYLGSEKSTRVQSPPGGIRDPQSPTSGQEPRGASEGKALAPREFPPVPAELREHHLAFGGQWTVRPEFSVAGRGATLALQFRARRVYLVMTTAGGGPARARVSLNGRPLAGSGAGRDLLGGSAAEPALRAGVVNVEEQRLYSLVDLPSVQEGRLEIRPDPGVRVYAFTFG